MGNYGGNVSWGKIQWEYDESSYDVEDRINVEQIIDERYVKGEKLIISGTGPIPDYYSEFELPWYPRTDSIVEILIEDVTANDEVTVSLSVCTFLSNKEKKEELIDVISKFQISNENKRLFNEVLKDDLFLNKVPKKYREPLLEITSLYRG
jgi:hypothetical protein